MSIKTNTASLQNLLDAVNNLPEAENLDSEISTQTTLISEQGAKIAELAEILSSKASGGASNVPMVSVTITDEVGMNGAYYFDENSTLQNVVETTTTVRALCGIVFTRTPSESITVSGNYILSNELINAVRFLEDGGTVTVGF